MNYEDEEYIDLLKLAKALLRKWKIIRVSTIGAGIIATMITLFAITPLYKARALMYVNNSDISLGSMSISTSDLTASKSLVDTYIVIMQSRNTLEDVIKKAKVDYTYEELSQMISASAVNKTEVFQIEVTSRDPVEAKLIANTIADILPEKINAIVDGSSARIVDYAVTPARKASPSNTKNVLIGLILGFVASCGVIVVLTLLDDEVHGEEDLTDNFDIPVLAAIPELMNSHSSGYGYGYGEYSKGGEN